jgi:3-deoxy-D-manno-octulosonic-acid transferase
MWAFAYSVLLVIAWPWVHLRLRWRARREPAYGERIAERFGHVPPTVPAGSVWFHTVSAGETIAAAALIAALVERFPRLPFLVTTMTPTGSAQVLERLGARVHHCYAPYDFPWAVRRFYRSVQPRLLVLMETELWPNLTGEAARRDVPVLLVNARLSERSARGYARLGGLTRTLLARLRWVACQYPDHARRFETLGVPPERLLVHGSVKFDVTLPADHGARVEALRGRWGLGGAPVWIAASTHPGEEAVVLDVHRRLLSRHPGARLVLVPRHPTRADEVARLCAERGLCCVRQSRPDGQDRAAAVVVGDTMGGLLYLYALADLAFVGGSLVDVGGHNPIEPALCGIPIVMGQAVFNFPDVVAAFREAQCLVLVSGGDELLGVLDAWLSDPAARAAAGTRAQAVVAANTGASERLRGLLEREIGAAAAADRGARRSG